MTYHVPVMAREAIEMLQPEPGSRMLDATMGGGGHSMLVANAIGANGILICVDRDNNAHIEASRKFETLPVEQRPRIEMIHARFDAAAEEIKARGIDFVNGALFDLGLSSYQIDSPERGFSFKYPSAPLDMRMDQGSMELTAADLLNELSEEEIAKLLRENADERWASRIANFVAVRRKGAPYRTVGQLVDTVLAAIPAGARPRDIHPATRTFEAIRIAVNGEFEALETALRKVIGLLAPGGRVAVISYHSGEDRIVKRAFSVLSGKCVCPPTHSVCTCEAASPQVILVTRKPLVPDSSEIAVNPRSRSAKMRVAQRRSQQDTVS